jgi:hypothetical protein
MQAIGRTQGFQYVTREQVTRPGLSSTVPAQEDQDSEMLEALLDNPDKDLVAHVELVIAARKELKQIEAQKKLDAIQKKHEGKPEEYRKSLINKMLLRTLQAIISFHNISVESTVAAMKKHLIDNVDLNIHCCGKAEELIAGHSNHCNHLMI